MDEIYLRIDDIFLRETCQADSRSIRMFEITAARSSVNDFDANVSRSVVGIRHEQRFLSYEQSRGLDHSKLGSVWELNYWRVIGRLDPDWKRIREPVI